VARLIFRNFWSFIALTAALSEWLLWQWFFQPDATLVTHLAVITLLLGYNRLEWLVAFWALQCAGAVTLLGNAWWSDEEAAAAIALAEPSAVLK